MCPHMDGICVYHCTHISKVYYNATRRIFSFKQPSHTHTHTEEEEEEGGDVPRAPVVTALTETREA